jgi:hypothetical protein
MPLRATAGVALLLALLALAAPVATATTSIVSQPAAGSPGSNASDATRDVATASENVTVENLTVWTAPGSIRDRLDDREAIATARRTGNLTRDGTVARSDALVLSMRIPGLAARMDNVTGANETVRFIRATNGTDSSVRLVQTNPTTEVPEKIVGLHRSGAMTVVVDRANDTYYLVVDLTESRVGFRDYGESISPDGVDWNPRMDPNVRRGELFAVNVTIDGHTSLFDTDRDSSRPDAVVHVVGVDAEFGATDALDVLVLQATTGQPVRARTSLAPGTPVVVRIENRSDGGPAIVRRTHVVETTTGGVGDDRFEPVTHEILATVDTSGVAPNTTFDARIVADGRTDDRRPGLVRRTDASVTLSATESWRDGRVNVTSATLSEGGFLVAQAGDRQALSDPDGILYRGHVRVDPGTHRNVTIPVETWGIFRLSAPLPESVTVVAVRDANVNGEYDEGDLPYVENSTAVTGVASVPDPRPAPEDVPEEMVTDTPTPTFSPPSTTSPGAPSTTAGGPTGETPTTRISETTATPPTTRTPGTTAGTGDGFGVALAVLAVVATTLLARRRKELVRRRE